ncbi:DUF3618 domain-containing protein [Actinomadura fulvescens]|uniref:DUF3618 domain-containing protein n=1 Tax=Actinomadura fulvescens TaxID=46160 RepID=A0ABN3QA70_9ACTN
MTDHDQELRAQRDRTEQARNDLGATVGELASRADVKARAQQKAGELKERAREATPEAATKAADQVRKRPGPVAGTAAAAVALIVGRRLLRGRRLSRAATKARAKASTKAGAKARSMTRSKPKPMIRSKAKPMLRSKPKAVIRSKPKSLVGSKAKSRGITRIFRRK